MPAPPPSEERTGPSSCAGCRHLYTTWRPQRPRGCRAYGFEAQTWPCAVVLEATGEPCALHAPREMRDPSRGRSPQGGGGPGVFG